MTSDDQPEPVDAIDLKILYIEDEEVLEPLLKYIRSKYGPRSVGVRSLEEAENAIEAAADQGEFHFAIHDCRIFYNEGDEVVSGNAGDALYIKLVRAGIPVVVLSGNTPDREPYVSTPPALGYISKPTGESKIDIAVQNYRDYLKETGN